MAKRIPPSTPFYPPNDQATYRDLLLFEERLKTNALALIRRKKRYQCALYHSFPLYLLMPLPLGFLAQLAAVIIFLLSEVLLQTTFLTVPYRLLRFRQLDVEVHLHPYVTPGLLLVSLTTFALFFASGMYGEKIAYANR